VGEYCRCNTYSISYNNLHVYSLPVILTLYLLYQHTCVLADRAAGPLTGDVVEHIPVITPDIQTTLLGGLRTLPAVRLTCAPRREVHGYSDRDLWSPDKGGLTVALYHPLTTEQERCTAQLSHATRLSLCVNRQVISSTH